MDGNSGKQKYTKMLTSQPFVLFVFIILVSIFTNAINDRFLTWSTVNSIIGQATGLGLVACGATILVISGHFDISVGRMVGLCMCVMSLMINAGVNEIVASIAGVLLCVVCSMINGALSILFNAPTMIVTLATGSIYYSMALILTNGYMQTLYGKYRFLASYRIGGVVPFFYLVLLAGFVFIFFLLRNTRTGRQVFAIGTNAKSAYISDLFRNVSCVNINLFFLIHSNISTLLSPSNLIFPNIFFIIALLLSNSLICFFSSCENSSFLN